MARCKKCFKKVGILADEPDECSCGEQELLDPEAEAEIEDEHLPSANRR